jgi:hypothetical protein
MKKNFPENDRREFVGKCDSSNTTASGYTQYNYTSNKIGYFYINPSVNKTLYILAVGGGGSGGFSRGGGGGAGGFVEMSYNLIAGVPINIRITVGSGGESRVYTTGTSLYGNIGKNTTCAFKDTYTDIISYGGGAGAGNTDSVSKIIQNGASGGGAANGNTIVGQGNFPTNSLRSFSGKFFFIYASLR